MVLLSTQYVRLKLEEKIVNRDRPCGFATIPVFMHASGRKLNTVPLRFQARF